MPLLRYDFAVDQNADVGPLPFNWGMLDPSGDPRLTTYPYSLAGATVKAQIRAARDAGALLYCALTVGSGLALTAVAIGDSVAQPAAPNGFSIMLTQAQTATFPDGATLYYDVEVTVGGVTSYWLQGEIFVNPTGTR